MTGFIYRAIVGPVLVLGLFGFGANIMDAGHEFVPAAQAARAARTAQAAKAVPADKLARVEAQVDRDYKGVKQMSASQLEKLRRSGKPVVIFDVREKAEYKVSHIKGAKRLEPGTWGWTFMRKYGGRLKGKTVVFYCSVGVRSSTMAARVQQDLAAEGAQGTYNLRGGIFRWHNDKRPLVNARGKTPYVHPYDKHWGKLVNRQAYVSYKPVK